MTMQDPETDPDSQLLDRALPAIARLEASLAEEREASHDAVHSDHLLDILTNLGHAITEDSEEMDALNLIAPDKAADEILNSRIISWLLDPLAHHRQAGHFIAALLNATEAPPRLLESDWSAAQVIQEWRNGVDEQQGYLDILVLDRVGQNLIAIENKVFSQEHSNQLTRYQRALAEAYPDFARHHIFLSPSLAAKPAWNATENTGGRPATPSYTTPSKRILADRRPGTQRERSAANLCDDHQEKHHAGHQH